MSNVLITGITGFIGSNLVKYLNKSSNINVFGQSRDPDRAKEIFGDMIRLCVRDVSSDWLDENNINTIVHLAGIAHDIKGKYKEKDYYHVNFEATRDLYSRFLASSTSSKFIFLSSVKAVADTCEDILDESVEPEPVTPYGKSKLEAEKAILHGIKTGKQAYILRPAMVYGPGNKGNLNLLYRFVKSGLPYPLAAFENKRSFLSVHNLCFIVDSLIMQHVPSGIYHLSDGNDLSTNELVDIIGEAGDKHPNKWSVPKLIIRSIASIGTIFKLPFNKQTLQKLTESYRVSNKRITEVLGDMPYKTQDELINTIHSIDEH
ncbi:NAD-dependent epimerase/dehydratase family protein [Bacteroidota bacterium]